MQNSFSTWQPLLPSCISDRNDFSYFLSTRCPNNSYQVLRIGLSVQEKKSKTDFQDGGHGSHLGFPIWTILATFDLQVATILTTKVRVIWAFGSGEEVQNRFLRWWPWPPSWISDQNDFNYSFYLQITPLLPTNFQSVDLLVQEKKSKYIFSTGQPWPPSWISDQNYFSFFWTTSHPDTSYQVSSQLAFRFIRTKAK